MRTECPDCGHDDHPYQCLVIWMGERCDCGAPPVVRPGPCDHPDLSDQIIRDYSYPRHQSLDVPLRCERCGEIIYPSQGVDDDIGWAVTAYIGEPYGAGM